MKNRLLPAVFWSCLFVAVCFVGKLWYDYLRFHASPVALLVQESRNKNLAHRAGVFQSNPLRGSDLPLALNYIKANKDYTSYHLLMVLRTYYPEEYDQIPRQDQAQILCSTLQSSELFDEWGFLTGEGPAGAALVETGRASLPFLVAILDDEGQAFISGSISATHASVNHYRRKDYAFRYVSLILGEKPPFDRDPLVRDLAINALKDRLARERN